MQPHALTEQPGERERLLIMERVSLDVRRLWFSGEQWDLGIALLLREPGGSMIMLVDGSDTETEDLLRWAVEINAYIVHTPFTRPTDFAARLRHRGFRLIQRHGEYVWTDPPAPFSQDVADRRGLLSFLRRRERSAISVAPIDATGLPLWNEVSWRAFGGRTGEVAALAEKSSSFQAMGEQATWYLASMAGRPVGTAILYRGDGADQILAVGTLPAYRRHGVATALMSHLLESRRPGDGSILFLDAAPGSHAERLYLQLGFRRAYFRDIYAPPAP